MSIVNLSEHYNANPGKHDGSKFSHFLFLDVFIENLALIWYALWQPTFWWATDIIHGEIWIFHTYRSTVAIVVHSIFPKNVMFSVFWKWVRFHPAIHCDRKTFLQHFSSLPANLNRRSHVNDLRCLITKKKVSIVMLRARLFLFTIVMDTCMFSKRVEHLIQGHPSMECYDEKYHVKCILIV